MRDVLSSPDYNAAHTMARPHILIVSPASARENNGNWQTASRWQRHLARRYRVTIAPHWESEDAAPDLLIALHARRSARALAAFTDACPDRPSILVLTGTDLYRDIHQHDAAGRSARDALARAGTLVLLQPRGLDELDSSLHPKARVIFQSAPRSAVRRHALTHAGAPLDIVMIGHLRAEKDPLTFIRAARQVRAPNVRLMHIGAALEAALGDAARAEQATNPRYRWLGALPHAPARRRLARCHAMVIASTMEGGANVIIEAVMSGVPVLASDIKGNRGMLGEDYAGYFAPGDAQALAALIERCVGDARFHALLRRQCAVRARLFAPEAERARVLDLADNLLSPTPRHQAPTRNPS
jgi:putative glycosyltransferase (TIGR04348 family)